MSEKNKEHSDKMIETKINETSEKLNISVEDLINRYVKRGLYMDDYYEPPKLTREELLEMGRKEVEKDRKRGIYPKDTNFDVFVNRWSKNKDWLLEGI